MKTDRPGKVRIHFRIQDKEYEELIPLFKKYRGIGKYFMFVSKLHSDKASSLRIETRKELTQFYKKYQADLAHIGSNLNQHIRHCNELNKIGSLSKSELEKNESILQELNTLLLTIQNSLFDLTKTISKI